MHPHAAQRLFCAAYGLHVATDQQGEKPMSQEKMNLDAFAQALYNRYSYQYVDEVVAFVKEHARDEYSEALEEATQSTLESLPVDEMLAPLKKAYFHLLEEIIQDYLDEYLDCDKEYTKDELLAILDEHSEEVEEQICEVYREQMLDDQEFSCFIAVSDTMAIWLQDRGEIVMSLLGMDIWCRVEGGQQAYMDSVIQDIAKQKGEEWGWKI
jgi:hypothetical protein